ncbi:MAG TPA: type II toxin-antitoxin system VapC family toxin [Acidiferrobacterales bacterium]|nr:type II toxin-antitoxin system VapC family toxin [Acidiferrobacterales bacterium]
MARRPHTVVLDSWAVLAFFEGEPAGSTVSELISEARDQDEPLLMSTVNAGEVWYIIAREVSEPEADQAVESLRKMGIEFVDADWPLTRTAGTFKAKHRMSYADCFAAALAKSRKADLVTGDKEFKQVEHDITVRWLARS